MMVAVCVSNRVFKRYYMNSLSSSLPTFNYHHMRNQINTYLQGLANTEGTERLSKLFDVAYFIANQEIAFAKFASSVISCIFTERICIVCVTFFGPSDPS